MLPLQSVLPSWRQGFTLLELMVVVAIVGILSMVAVPSFTTLMNNNRLTAQANQLVASVQLARSEAVRSGGRVTFCGVASKGSTTCATSGTPQYWIVKDGGGLLNEIAIKSPVVASADGNLGTSNGISFSADGLARKADGTLLNGALTVCIPTRRPEQNKRTVSLASGSRVSVAATGDGGGTCT